MLFTQLCQGRLTLEVLLGNRITASNLHHLLAAARRAYQEYGSSSPAISPLLLDANTTAAEDYQDHLLERTVRAARRFSPYYHSHLPTGLHEISRKTLARLPLTCRQDLQCHRQTFLANHTRPVLAVGSSGTTGRPIEISYSQNELEVWAALGALSLVLAGAGDDDACLQLNVNLKSAVPYRYFLEWLCLGWPLLPLGLVSPEESLDTLLRQAMPPTLLVTYPSYLAQLVQVAWKRGIGPGDTHLRRIICGGEILSSSLAASAQRLFGAPVVDSYGQTETAPLSAQVCSQGHLHFDTNSAYVEVLAPGGRPATAGELGTLVVTPYYPLRHCMPLLRYQTDDLVRVLPDAPLSCELAMLPATSPILGKRERLLWVEDQSVTPRDFTEAIESLPTRPYAARYFAEVTCQGLIVSLLEQAVKGLTSTEVKQHFQQAGLPVAGVRIWPAEFSFNRLCPQRADPVVTPMLEKGGGE